MALSKLTCCFRLAAIFCCLLTLAVGMPFIKSFTSAALEGIRPFVKLSTSWTLFLVTVGLAALSVGLAVFAPFSATANNSCGVLNAGLDLAAGLAATLLAAALSLPRSFARTSDRGLAAPLALVAALAPALALTAALAPFPNFPTYDAPLAARPTPLATAPTGAISAMN